jgi:hypothetical protein
VLGSGFRHWVSLEATPHKIRLVATRAMMNRVFTEAGPHLLPPLTSEKKLSWMAFDAPFGYWDRNGNGNLWMSLVLLTHTHTHTTKRTRTGWLAKWTGLDWLYVGHVCILPAGGITAPLHAQHVFYAHEKTSKALTLTGLCIRIYTPIKNFWVVGIAIAVVLIYPRGEASRESCLIICSAYW